MKSFLPEVGYGLVLGLATLVWISLEYAMGLHTTRISYHPIVTNFFAVIPIYLMWRALKHRRDVIEGGQILWWQGMTSGMIISVVAGALGAPTIWIFIKYVNPNFFAAMIEYSVKTGYHAKTEHAEAYFNLAGYMIQATLGPVIMGFFTSVILTAIARWQVNRRTKAAPEPT
jgi:hypothetical protein